VRRRKWVRTAQLLPEFADSASVELDIHGLDEEEEEEEEHEEGYIHPFFLQSHRKPSMESNVTTAGNKSKEKNKKKEKKKDSKHDTAKDKKKNKNKQDHIPAPAAPGATTTAASLLLSNRDVSRSRSEMVLGNCKECRVVKGHSIFDPLAVAVTVAVQAHMQSQTQALAQTSIEGIKAAVGHHTSRTVAPAVGTSASNSNSNYTDIGGALGLETETETETTVVCIPWEQVFSVEVITPSVLSITLEIQRYFPAENQKEKRTFRTQRTGGISI
jgi:hypothetical protein